MIIGEYIVKTYYKNGDYEGTSYHISLEEAINAIKLNTKYNLISKLYINK